MLEGLDSVEWHHLSHAYGPATDVPDLLRALQSPDEEIREEAHTQLYISICHQGTVYEATAYAVPFLIELLSCCSVRDMSGILSLLTGIAKGSSYLDAHKSLMSFEEERNAPEFEAELAEELAWVRRSHKAVGEGIPLYLNLLHHPDSNIRMTALRLLSLFKEQAQHIVPKLQELLDSEPDDRVKATAMLSLAAVIEYESQEFTLLSALLSAEQSALLRFVAALAVARCAKEQTPPDVLRSLVNAVEEAEIIDQLYSRLPWGGLVVSHVDKALVNTGTVLGIPSLIDMLSKLGPSVHARDTVVVVICLLDLAFYGHKILDTHWASGRGKDGRYKMECWSYPGKPRHSDKQQEIPNAPAKEKLVKPFTEAQRAALTAVVNYEPLWEIDTNLFEVYGLPNSREALRNLLV